MAALCVILTLSVDRMIGVGKQGGTSTVAAEQHLADLAAVHASLPPFAREAADVAASQGTDSASGLTGPLWLAAIGLALALPLVIEAGKWIRRQRTPELTTLDTERAVAPAHALKEGAR